MSDRKDDFSDLPRHAQEALGFQASVQRNLSTEPAPCCERATPFTGLCPVHTPYQQGVLEGARSERERIIRIIEEERTRLLNRAKEFSSWSEKDLHSRRVLVDVRDTITEGEFEV